jgi:hypothetical protein
MSRTIKVEFAVLEVNIARYSSGAEERLIRVKIRPAYFPKTLSA